MGFTKMKEVVDGLRSMSKDPSWYYDLSKENPDTLPEELRFDAIIVDLQSKLATLHGGSVVNGADVLRLLNDIILQDMQQFGTTRFVFCFDDSRYVYNAKETERAMRQKSRTEGTKKYGDHYVVVKSSTPNGPPTQVPIDDYQYGLDVNLPAYYAQVLSERRLITRWKRFVATLLTSHLSSPNPVTGAVVFVCGVELDLGGEVGVTKVIFPAGQEKGIPVKKDRVKIGESECRCFYWLRRFIAGNEVKGNVMVRCNDSDAIALGMFCVPRDLYDENISTFSRGMWLDISARHACRRYVDAVSMWRNVVGAMCDIADGVRNATELVMLVCMITGNDYCEKTQKLTPAVALRYMCEDLIPGISKGTHRPPVRVIHGEGEQTCDFIADEDALMDFIVGALQKAVGPCKIGAKKRKESVSNALLDRGLVVGKTPTRKLVDTLHEALEENLARAAEAAVSAGKDPARTRWTRFHLPPYDALRARVRAAFSSLHYFMNGHLEIERDAYETDEEGLSVFGYARDEDGNACFAEKVSETARNGQPFITEHTLRKAEQRKREREGGLVGMLAKKTKQIDFKDCSEPGKGWGMEANASMSLSKDDSSIRTRMIKAKSRGMPVDTHCMPDMRRAENKYRKNLKMDLLGEVEIDYSRVERLAENWDARRSSSTSPVQGEHGTFISI